ncbi:MAG: phosphofructokinase [Desulfobacteraceae bacterium]|nr:phosphofructokinase [Desulfobacteraceae bacterium]
MPNSEEVQIQNLLQNPKVKQVIGDVNDILAARKKYMPRKCDVFMQPFTGLSANPHYTFKINTESQKQFPDIIHNVVKAVVGFDTVDDPTAAKFKKKRNIGIVFSGGPAPGGHNVIAGLYDAAKSVNPETQIFGFLLGPDGIIENEHIEITGEMVDHYRNVGGFGMIKTGRTKIDTPKKMSSAKNTCKSMNLDALVIVGGDDSNTNAAFLAQELYLDGIQVIGVPKTIDGDLQVKDENGHVLCAISFGFHSAARSFANQISNLCSDGSSDVKYWHICKVMGRVASHLALEVALQTHANMTFIGEDLADYMDRERLAAAEKNNSVDYNAYGMTLRHLSRLICDGIVRRARNGKNYGVMVLPEGILEFINEIQVFIIKLNTIIAEYNEVHDTDFHSDFPVLDDKLEYLRRLARRLREDRVFSIWNTRDDDLFSAIPAFFQEGLLMERDSHGNFPFSQVETEKVIMGLVEDYLNTLKEQGIYKVGIHREYFLKIMKESNLDPERIEKALSKTEKAFSEYLIIKESIISVKTLKQELVKGGAIRDMDEIPPGIEKIYKKSIPNFKTQVHFYGYDGRGSDPTKFDATYTYNLGHTAFSLIANGETGQMAAIKNLEKGFPSWEPIGIPIAPLMHFEERKGKLQLVLERSVVDVTSTAFKVVKALREEWLAANPGPDHFRNPGPVTFFDDREETMPITLMLNANDLED